MPFYNREQELAALEQWWQRPQGALGLIWGRRRVGKTALLQEFAAGKRVVFHTAVGRPVADELALLSRAAAQAVDSGLRDLGRRPFADWEDALETLGQAAVHAPLLVVLDEFPELVSLAPDLENRLRAFWERAAGRTKLRILLCGSAVRTMERIQEARSPLYGRIDHSLLLRPLAPHETAPFLSRLSPADRALVWGLVGGVPLYLTWWNQGQSVRENVLRLVCTPGGQLLTAGELVLASDLDTGELGRRVIYAIARGRTKFNEIQSAVGTDPTRALERLQRLEIVEKVVPVTADPARARTGFYRIGDNMLAFWLSIVDSYRAEIERGLGRSILDVLVSELDDHLGSRWEEAFRLHLRRLAAEGRLLPDIVAIGPFWNAARPPVEIDAVALAGRRREVALVGEARWARREDGERARRRLEEKAQALPRRAARLVLAVCAREEVRNPHAVLAFTARDLFG